MGDCSSCSGSCESSNSISEDIPTMIKYHMVELPIKPDLSEVEINNPFGIGDRVYSTGTGESGTVKKLKNTMCGLRIDRNPNSITYFEARHLIIESDKDSYLKDNQRLFAAPEKNED